MRPKITGTSSTSIWIDITPRSSARRLFGWFLITTGSYKLGLLGRGRLAVLLTATPLFLLLLLFHGRQKRVGEIRKLGFFVLAKRLDEVRGDYDQQFVSRFLRRRALEEIAEDGNIAQVLDLLDLFRDVVVDQTGDCEAFAIFEHDFGLSFSLRQRGDEESLQRDGIGEVE